MSFPDDAESIDVETGSFFAELKRRNVLRAGALYAGAIWALAQGVAQLGPAFGLPDSLTRWCVTAGVTGFPFWLAFSWFYELTPEGLKRESEIGPDDSISRQTGKKLDRLIIAVLTLAVVLPLTERLLFRDADAPAVMPTTTSAAIPGKSIAVLPLRANEES
ncbi:MAG TPA: hypothetical protein VGH81_13415 [Rudaea sp.]